MQKADLRGKFSVSALEIYTLSERLKVNSCSFHTIVLNISVLVDMQSLKVHVSIVSPRNIRMPCGLFMSLLGNAI